jgi:hypothetical protein
MKEKSAPIRRPKHQVKASGLLSRLRDDIPAPTREVARARIRSTRGLFASLSDEDRARWDGYDGPEVLGPSPEPAE